MKHTWTDPHVRKTFKNLVKAVYITFAAFAILYAAFLIARTSYSNHLSEVGSNNFKKGLAEELHHLKTEGDAILTNQDLITNLIESRREEVLEILQQEAQDRDIQRLAVSDVNGLVILRSANAGRFGDNVFLTTPVGRALSEGKAVESVEATGFYNQLFLTTGRPIYADGEMIGSLFANALLNDEFLVDFKEAYLSAGSEVVFYAKDKGVYGNSFSDIETKNLISSYITPGSNWIRDTYTNVIVILDNGRSYLVSHIILNGLEDEVGGVLIFTPRIDISKTVHTVITILVILIFLFLVIRNHLLTNNEERGYRYWIILSMFTALTFTAVFYFQHFPESGISRLHRVPYPLYNSTITLQPEWGIYNVHTEQKFTVVVNTGDEVINTVGVGLKYDSEKIEVVDLDTTSSPCSYIVEKEIDSLKGMIAFSCVILNDHPQVESLPLFTITAKLKKPGTFNLSFDSTQTTVLANDGLGTEVLRTTQDGSYKVDDFDFLTKNATSSKRNFIVFSPSHPNQARWYSNETVRFVWIGEPEAVYDYEFDTSSSTIPNGKFTTKERALEINIPGDGIYYFHIKTLSGSAVAHYKIQSDETPPTITKMSFDKAAYTAGDVARLSFLASDVSSGVQNNYYVDLGDQLFLPTGPMLFIPFVEEGARTLKLRVYDRAGNYTEEFKKVEVKSKTRN